jgi:serine/threonine protein kinase
MSDENKSIGNKEFPSLMSIPDINKEDATAVQTHGPWTLDDEDSRAGDSGSADRRFDDSRPSQSLDSEPVRDSLLDLPELPELPDPTGHTKPLPPSPSQRISSKPSKQEPAHSAAAQIENHGRQIIGGRYEIQARIGEGGMGRVYRVKHLGLGKLFALKIIRSVLADDEGARRAFFREARLASSLSHASIVSIVDFGEDASYGVYMVMEIVEGEPLRKVLREKGRFGVRQAADIMIQVADAIRYVHEKGVVHCDIKAENILLSSERSEAGRRMHRVKLLDFGLARPQTTTASSASMSIQGTPAYIAPERIKGAPPAPSMDIYALGILFYELLTGNPPWNGALHLVLACHVNEAPKPLSEVLGEPVDDRVESLIAKTLNKDPEDRQKSVGAFIYELKTMMEMLGFQSRRRSRSQPSTAKTSRNEIVETTFAECPLPLAAFSSDGTILVGNKAFSVFLYREQVDLRGVSLRETPIARACPNLNHEIRTVLAEGRTLQVPLETMGADGSSVELAMWLSPGPEESENVYCAIHLVNKPPV